MRGLYSVFAGFSSGKETENIWEAEYTNLSQIYSTYGALVRLSSTLVNPKKAMVNNVGALKLENESSSSVRSLNISWTILWYPNIYEPELDQCIAIYSVYQPENKRRYRFLSAGEAGHRRQDGEAS